MTTILGGILIVLAFLGVVKSDAGKALQFSDNIATAFFCDFPGDEFTFEAWVSVRDVCHPKGTLLSFAASQDDGGQYSLQAKMNAFVIANPYRVVACRSFEDLYSHSDGCIYQVWGNSYEYTGNDYYDVSTSNLYSATGSWRHLAVTYKHDYENNQDHYKIFVDGLPAQVASVSTSKFVSWKNGTLVLGSDQDCLGGCTSSQQSFYGGMDEVKIWKRVLSDKAILQNMRLEIDYLNNQIPEGLVAYWNFDEVENNVAKDLSGHGHDLYLKQLPQSTEVRLNNQFQTSSLTFKNSWAMKSDVKNMPNEDFTVEFWATTPQLDKASQQYEQPGIFSFASVDPGNGNVDDDKWLQDADFLFDAISISKHNSDYWSSKVGLNSNGRVSTLGAVSLHVNNFEIVFLANWTDSDWHHIAVTWVKTTGFSRMYFDQKELIPYAVIPPVNKAPLDAAVSLDADDQSDDYYDYFYQGYDYFYYQDDYDYAEKQNKFNEMGFSKKHAGNYEKLYDLIKVYNESVVHNYLDLFRGVDPTAGTNRSSIGSLVLGQLQRNYGGGFMRRLSFKGAIAVVRVWSKALELERIKRNMNTETTPDKRDLVMMYNMQVSNGLIRELQSGVNNLLIGGLGPVLRPSTAPLSTSTGVPVHPPQNPTGGYALRLNNQVTVLRPKINFPNKAVTVEFWMQSTDTCRQGSPFSYATGNFVNSDDDDSYYYYDYWYYGFGQSSGGEDKAKNDTFLIADYNSWKVRVMNDDSKESDLVGVSATDGNWHYIAVTWRSQTGSTALYQDGKLLYRTKRAKNKVIPANGTLVVGRDQDCGSGCFHDGDTYDLSDSRDFYGLIDEIRLWSRVLSPQEIESNFRKDAARFTSKVDVSADVSMSSQNLVARWNFDEGQGYIVNDVSGNGNHLYISGQPIWEPVVITSVCGNGVVEELEECDDGNLVSGDGCSTRCRVEPGSTCIGSPSICTKLDFVQLKTSNSGSDKSQHGGVNGGIIAVVVTLIVVFAMLAVAVMMRERIYEQFPWVEDKMERLFRSRAAILWTNYNNQEYTSFDYESLTNNNSGNVVTSASPKPVQASEQPQPTAEIPLSNEQNAAPSTQQNGYAPIELVEKPNS